MFKKIDYQNILDLITLLQKSQLNSSIFRITDLFKKYPNIPRPQCSSNDIPCENFLIELSDFEKGDEYVKKLPTLFLIAGFHGDEVTGTNTFYQFLKSLNQNYSDNSQIINILKNTRILILPTANVSGFSKIQREEKLNNNIYDPNRDFPYDLSKGTSCFDTSTAMIIDTIFRENLIVGCFTFHGGDNSISYPWGNYAHEKDTLTGDNIAFDQIVQIFKKVAGGNKNLNIENYNVGNLQSTVYDVNGGFEDWAYGASWDKINVPQSCSKKQFSQFYQEKGKIEYEDPSNRAFIYLVEAGDKIPADESLGNEISLYFPKDPHSIYGHISRNLRMSLIFAELMNPIIEIQNLNYDGKNLMINLEIKGCQTLNTLTIENLQSIVASNIYNELTNSVKVQLQINNPDKNLKNIRFNFQCDQNWEVGYQKKQPETHFVKMRTDPNYNVNYQGYQLKSINTIYSDLLNLNIDKLLTGRIIKLTNNKYNMVYTDQIKIITDQEEFSIQLPTNSNVMKIVQEKQQGIKIIVHSLSQNQSPRYLLDMKQPEKVSFETFYGFIGRKIEVQNNDKIQKGVIIIDPESALFIPPQGLTGLKQNEFGTFYFEIFFKEEKNLEIILWSNTDQPLIIQVGNLKIVLDKPQLQKVNIFKYFKTISVNLDNLDNLRILGLGIDVKNSLEEILFDIPLVIKNIYIDEFQNIEFQPYSPQNLIFKKKEIQEIQNTNKGVFINYLILGIIIGAFFGAVIIKCAIKKEREHEIEMIRELSNKQNQFIMTEIININANEIQEWLVLRRKLEQNWFLKFQAIKKKEKDVLHKLQQEVKEEQILNFFEENGTDLDYIKLKELEKILINSKEGEKRNLLNFYSSPHIKNLRAILQIYERSFIHIASLSKDLSEIINFLLPAAEKQVKENAVLIQDFNYRISQAQSRIHQLQKDLISEIKKFISDYEITVDELDTFNLDNFLNEFFNQLPKILEELEKHVFETPLQEYLKYYQEFAEYNNPNCFKPSKEIYFQEFSRFLIEGDFFLNGEKIEQKKQIYENFIDQQGYHEKNSGEKQIEYIFDEKTGELIQQIKEQKEIPKTILLDRQKREDITNILEELRSFFEMRMEEIVTGNQTDINKEIFILSQKYPEQQLKKIILQLTELIEKFNSKQLQTIFQIFESSRSKQKIKMTFEKIYTLISKNKEKIRFSTEKTQSLLQQLVESRKQIQTYNKSSQNLRKNIVDLLSEKFKANFIISLPLTKKQLIQILQYFKHIIYNQIQMIKKTVKLFSQIKIQLPQIERHFMDNYKPFQPETTTNKEELIRYYREMNIMRRIESTADKLYKSKEILGFCHLYDGQEACALGMSEILNYKDPISAGYRIHPLAYTRGITPFQLFAEMLGKDGGASKGKGGSMHYYNSKNGFFGGSGIVGDQIPVAAGLAFALKYTKNKQNVAVALYGDGGANQGQFFESVNMAALWKLPVLFICENNNYAMGTSIQRHDQNSGEFHKKLSTIPGIKFNGHDVFEVREGIRYAKEFALTNGPLIVNLVTYRYHGHSMSDPGITYRNREEVQEVRKSRDPILLLKQHILQNNVENEQELEKIENEVKEMIEGEAEKARKQGHFKDLSLVEDVYYKGEKYFLRAPNYEDSIFVKENLVNQFKLIMEKKKKEQIIEEEDQERRESDLDQAFIDENVEGSENKLNISVNEKEDLEDLDDEQVEKEFSNFIQDIQKNDQVNEFFGQINQLMESGAPENDHFLGTLEGDKNFDNFTNNLLYEFVKKEVIYEPVVEAKKKIELYIQKNPKNRTQQNMKKLKLLSEVKEMLEGPDHNKQEVKQKIIEKFEELNELGGLPDDIMKECMKNNKQFADFQKMTKEKGCSIF